ncbi:MAG: hypothetical protein GQ570_04615 [Helicobacteraceae bacterium]|nr:hypothetical protein [Helicobacteraceae bacterium]
MNKSSKKTFWPYAIGISIVSVVFACAYTIYFALQHPVELSDVYNRNYHDADRDVNKILMSEIAFNKLYDVKYKTQSFKKDNTVLIYKITTKDGRSFNDANLEVKLTRPDNDKNDIILAKPTVENGIYTFKRVELPLEGRWDISAVISANKATLHYFLKVDTRNNKIKRF